MVRLRGATVVGPDGPVERAALVIDDGLISEIASDAKASGHDLDCGGGWIVPGFIDTHIHGVQGLDVLDGGEAVARVAALLPRFGVTAFQPTSVACGPADLSAFLAAVAAAMAAPADAAARVLGAHLESNFINPAYKGAQPDRCLRLPPAPAEPLVSDGAFTGAAILAAIDTHRAAVRTVTLAPELPGALDLVARLAGRGHRVSLGHSAATFEQAQAAIAAGACRATHLFNRMPPLSHRAPGLAGAVLAAEGVTCEVVGDGHHVHPAMLGLAIRMKGHGGIAAITDASAVAGLPAGSTARLGDQTIRAGASCAELADGTIAGSLTTMDAVFRLLVRVVGLTVADAVHLTATTPAACAGRSDLGRLAVGHPADLVVLDRDLRVLQTWVAGRLAWNSAAGGAVSPAEVQR
ncbi:MAG: N-acetylglucosamine-6-phosphate deacetylase [Acidobacteria bacterium]|nr:N-acetylglucosamine-6-phosphate deacetylase [Acidobacteriota bacterium]